MKPPVIGLGSDNRIEGSDNNNNNKAAVDKGGVGHVRWAASRESVCEALYGHE